MYVQTLNTIEAKLQEFTKQNYRYLYTDTHTDIQTDRLIPVYPPKKTFVLQSIITNIL